MHRNVIKNVLATLVKIRRRTSGKRNISVTCQSLFQHFAQALYIDAAGEIPDNTSVSSILSVP